MSDKDNDENYTERALKNFHCSIFFCNKDFQSSCNISVSFSATNCHSDIFYWTLHQKWHIQGVTWIYWCTFAWTPKKMWKEVFFAVEHVMHMSRIGSENIDFQEKGVFVNFWQVLEGQIWCETVPGYLLERWVRVCAAQIGWLSASQV